MTARVPACRCGFVPCTADPDAAINALWQHIEEAHGLPDRLELAREHKGRFVWRNPETVWVCADDCPHPTHEAQP